MSYTCDKHGWRHGQDPCPVCSQDQAEIERLKALATKEQEDHHFYKREWESACERYNYANEERAQLERECEHLRSLKSELSITTQVLSKALIDRDRWQQMAEKLAVNLKRIFDTENGYHDLTSNENEETSRALAEFEAMTKDSSEEDKN
jgi:acetyl-CoA carboxylase beta subunit